MNEVIGTRALDAFAVSAMRLYKVLSMDGVVYAGTGFEVIVTRGN